MKINFKQNIHFFIAVFTCLAAGTLFAKDKTVGEKVDQGVNDVEKTAKATKDKAKEIAKNAEDKARELAKDAEDKVKETKDKAKEKAHEAIN